MKNTKNKGKYGHPHTSIFSCDCKRAEYGASSRIHYHIFSGNASFVTEHLNKGLIDFGILFRTPDLKKYEAFKLPSKDIWGVLILENSPLVEKETVV
ncbi:MAG: hypothetical protein K1V96_05260 [Lachnospiraceae bacterium]